MEQDQFTVSFPLGTKLLVSIVLLLMVVIGFLSFSTIVILNDDKKAYTYQSQATEAQLAGQGFKAIIQRAVDTLKVSLGSIDPFVSELPPRNKRALRSVINNQTEVVGVKFYRLNASTNPFELFSLINSNLPAHLEFKDQDMEVENKWFSLTKESLIKNGYAFFNLSKVELGAILGVVIADLKNKNHPKGMPVALGFVSLGSFSNTNVSSRLTIVNSGGWVLFDSNPSVQFSLTNVADDPLVTTAASSPVASGAKEYVKEDERFLGTYFRPGYGLSILTNTEWKALMTATFALSEKFVLLGLMAIGAAIVFAILFANTLTAPLGKLYSATKQVASGNFSLNLKTKSKDELGALSSSFNVMSSKIQELIKESVEKTRMQGELKIASTVQQTLIPPQTFKNKNILIKSLYESASECGGDWWGFFGVGNKMAVMIADATGHGIPSALITAAARSCFSVMHKLAQEDPDFTFSPGSMLAYTNRVIYEAAVGEIMMTFFIAVFDFEKNTLTYSNAGHNPPWLFKHQNGKYQLKSLTSRGKRLGEDRDVPPYDETVMSIGPKDTLFMYTDGLVELTNASGIQFGKKNTRKLVQAEVGNGPEAIIRKLVEASRKHSAGKPLDDDITLAAAVFYPQ